jgi:hypothetical protein
VNIVKKVVSVGSVFLLAAGVLGMARPASAEDIADVYGAYQYLHVSSGGDGESLPAGFAAGVTFPIVNTLRALRVVVDFGLNHKKEADDVKVTPLSFGAGLRFTPVADRNSKAHPYLQAILGAERTSVDVPGIGSSSTSDFMIQPGAGASFPIGTSSGFVEADYRHVNTALEAENDFVFRAGVVLHLGAR